MRNREYQKQNQDGNIKYNYYHPNEISAELITIYYLSKLGLIVNHKSKAYNVLFNFLK